MIAYLLCKSALETRVLAEAPHSYSMRAKRFNQMNRSNLIQSFGPAIRVLLVLLTLATAPAFAHDPGLSAARLKFGGDRLAVRLTFARDEIALIAPMDADRDGRITQPEFDAARARLESLAKESFAISVAGEAASPASVAVSLDESGAIHFDLEYPLPQGSNLTLSSRLIDKLRLGHRQFLTLRDERGSALSQRMLDATNNSFEFDLVALHISRERPHAFWGFLLLGVEHILLGFDHLAFLFALLIAGGTLREAAK